MVYVEDEILALFFLKKNGFGGVRPVGRIRRNALRSLCTSSLFEGDGLQPVRKSP
jgi:hypothetical protein